jgi:hypothetical protein
MAGVPESLREQATRLFALGLVAKERGEIEQADLLIAAASRCIDRAIDAEAAEAQAAGIPPVQAPEQRSSPSPDPDQPPARPQQVRPREKDTANKKEQE